MSQVIIAEILSAATELVSCDHCGIVVVNPREYGWKFWTEVTHNDEEFPLFSGEDGTTSVVRHHCPAAVQYNDCLAGGLIHGTDPDDAVVYQDWPT